MKKITAVVLALSLMFAMFIPANAAEGSTVYKWGSENLCEDGDFEFEFTPADAEEMVLPRYDKDYLPQDTPDFSLTGNWFSNRWDLQGVIVKGEGYNGGNALKISGDGVAPYGAAYWILPRDQFSDRDVITVSFLYKVSDAMKNGTPQIHAHIISDNVYAPMDPVAVIKDDPYLADDQLTEEACGFENYVGTPVGDDWYRITGSVACEYFGNRSYLRLFADFRQPEGGHLGNDAYVLFDDITVGKAQLTEDSDAAENLSSVNLVTGGTFEERALGEQLGTDYDDLGWGSTIYDCATTSVQLDADENKYLRIAGTGSNAYGLANFRMPELTAGKTYRLSFDYKFIAETADITLQAHASICSNAAMQAGNPGGWFNINLTSKPGEQLSNGYTRVSVDFVPDEFQVSAMTDLRFFIQLGSAQNDFGIGIDNVTLYDISNTDKLPEEIQNVVDMIDALGDVDALTESDKAAVEAAFNAYTALSDSQKAAFPYEKLALLNAAYEKLFSDNDFTGGNDTVTDDGSGENIPATGDSSSNTAMTAILLVIAAGACVILCGKKLIYTK